MENYLIKISKEEINILLTSLKDSQNQLTEILRVTSKSYYELSESEKFFWRNKSAYDKYIEVLRKDCCKQSDDELRLQEKLENVLNNTHNKDR